jgi:uncharacterized protein YdeI (YjbR/CyaY-like superfamily)
MGTKDPRFDACIEKSADFAKPIIKHLRTLVHRGCPGAVETVKWSHPSFEFPKGSILCGLAAFKAHCTIGFWKDKLLRTSKENIAALDALGRMESMDDLPSNAVILRLIKQAAKLNEDGVKLPARPKGPKKPPPKTPADFAAALKKAKSATTTYEAFSPSHKREYIEWITEAKADDTRQRRIAQAVEWIAEGKSRNWKYERK